MADCPSHLLYEMDALVCLLRWLALFQNQRQNASEQQFLGINNEKGLFLWASHRYLWKRDAAHDGFSV